MAEVLGTSSRQRWTLVLVCTAVFMLLLDITVVSVALPSIQRDLHASLPDLQWVSAAYALVLAVLLLPAATMGDRLGRRRLFLAGVVIFTVGSLACALAPTALALQLFRALQGVGGAVLFATATPLLRAEFSGAALARALGAFGATLGGATAIGPLAGGLLTDTLGWRSIFFINLPIGAAAFAGGVARLRESRDPAGGRADWVGTALITGALTALMFALIRGNELGWGSPVIVVLFTIAAVAFAGFVIYELRIAAAPMADLRLFARRSFAATGFVAFAISATVIGMIIYLSLYVQNTLGYSPVQAGLRFLPLSLVSFAVALLTGRLIGKVAMRVLLGVAMVSAAAGLVSMAHLTATSTWLVLLPGLILAGIGLGITSTGLASAALSAVEPAHAGMAAGLVNTLRQVGTATGVAVLGALYASRVTIATLHSVAGLPAPPRRCPSAGRRSRLQRRHPGCRLRPARRPRGGRSCSPRRYRQRAQRRSARRSRLRRARRDRRIRLRTRPSQAAAGPRPAPGTATFRARSSGAGLGGPQRRVVGEDLPAPATAVALRLDCPWLACSGLLSAGLWRGRGEALMVSSAEGLVGREAELAVAAAAVRQLSEGRALALAIEGEAGIGKTRLVQSIIDDVRCSRDVAVFCGQGHPFERSRPFGVIGAALGFPGPGPPGRRSAGAPGRLGPAMSLS